MPTSRKYPSQLLKELIGGCQSIAEVMRKLGIKPSGGSHSHLKERIIKENFDISHFLGSVHNKGKVAKNRKSWQEILCIYSEHKQTKAHLLKRALLESGRTYKCEGCNNTGHWQNKLLVLEIDHKDQNRQNNLPENLSFLCPNCHSQTRGFSGRKKQIKRKPPRKTLKKFLWEMPTTKIGNLFGVSDKAVEKWAKSYKLTKPPRGYWAKKKAGKI